MVDTESRRVEGVTAEQLQSKEWLEQQAGCSEIVIDMCSGKEASRQWLLYDEIIDMCEGIFRAIKSIEETSKKPPQSFFIELPMVTLPEVCAEERWFLCEKDMVIGYRQEEKFNQIIFG